jgi:hypothetical protein
MNLPAKFLPHNAQEFENEMRALIVSHMGLGQGNPTQWVVTAVCEAYQRGFALGFATGQHSTVSPPPSTFVRSISVERLPLVHRVDKEG